MGRQPNISFANLFDTVMLTVWHKSAKKKNAVNDNVFLTDKRGKKLKKKCIIRILVVN